MRKLLLLSINWKSSKVLTDFFEGADAMQRLESVLSLREQQLDKAWRHSVLFGDPEGAMDKHAP